MAKRPKNPEGDGCATLANILSILHLTSVCIDRETALMRVPRLVIGVAHVFQKAVRATWFACNASDAAKVDDSVRKIDPGFLRKDTH